MEKKLNQMQLGIVKRIAQNVNGNFEKVAKLNEKIEALVKERDTLQTMIDEMEAPVVRMTGGYKSTDLYDKVIVPQFNEDGTPKVNEKTGYQVKTTKYVLKYPDTILPVEEKTEIGNGSCKPAVAEETVEAPVMDAEPAEEVETPVMEDDAPFSL